MVNISNSIFHPPSPLPRSSFVNVKKTLTYTYTLQLNTPLLNFYKCTNSIFIYFFFFVFITQIVRRFPTFCMIFSDDDMHHICVYTYLTFFSPTIPISIHFRIILTKANLCSFSTSMSRDNTILTLRSMVKMYITQYLRLIFIVLIPNPFYRNPKTPLYYYNVCYNNVLKIPRLW